jgi:hypothetical protein
VPPGRRCPQARFFGSSGAEGVGCGQGDPQAPISDVLLSRSEARASLADHLLPLVHSYLSAPEYNEHQCFLAVGTASKLSLLRGTLGRRVRRQRDPGVA